MSVAAAALITAALLLGFYAAFTSDRPAFWTWLAAFAILMPADKALRKLTRMHSVRGMTQFYAGYGLRHPQLRARVVVLFARLLMPLFIAVAVNVDARPAVAALCTAHPVVSIAALVAGALIGPWYVYRDTLQVSGATG
ncbi:MAG TPA: hypothetical protein VFH72_06740 [Candidatus Baltobacteraceae bacterium]|nr:hypothetical protein [Candidatus Baltobacteraceae bacterium]